MSPAAARRTATGILAATLALMLAGQLINGFHGHDPGDSIYAVVILVATLVYLLIGRLIVSRQPGNTIGWLLLAIPLCGVLLTTNGDYATRALVDAPGSLPFGIASAWIDRWLMVPSLFLFIPIFLLFPDGRIPSSRWRWVLWLTIGAPVATTLAFAITPGRMTGGMAHLENVHVVNPLGVTWAASLVNAVTLIGGFTMLATAVLALIAIFARYRGAGRDVRQQIRWLAFVGVAFFTLLGLNLASSALGHQDDAIGIAMFTLMFSTLVLGIPVACGIAILRYHLYELDVVIRKAVVVAAIAVFFVLVYAAVVGGVGALVQSSSSTALSFTAAAVVAILFQPVLTRARRFADRVVYGKRATPYEVLSEFGHRLAETYAADEVLQRIARVLGEGVGADRARVWLRSGGEQRLVAAWPDDAASDEDDHVVEVRHRGELLGALSVAVPPNDPMDPSKEKLMADLAAQVGLVLRNVRLIQELRESRQRLVAAQDEERRKIERNIHDGVQQQLVALAVRLRLLEQVAERDPPAAMASADALQEAATQALDDLRDLARGIYPPLLADRGLAAALDAQARKAPIPVRVEGEDVGRHSREIESTVYFCALEALNNVTKYARASGAVVVITESHGQLTFEVTDDGTGFDPAETGYGTGLQGMADRLDAVGGGIEIRSAPGRGTTVSGSVPVAAHELVELGS